MTYRDTRGNKDVVLECGCITTNLFSYRVIGSGGKWYQFCETHPNGKGRWGGQVILREASLYERIRFYGSGIPAPKRRSAKAPDWVSAMHGLPKPKAYGNGTAEPTLF